MQAATYLRIAGGEGIPAALEAAEDPSASALSSERSATAALMPSSLATMFSSPSGGTFAMDVQDDGVQAATYLRIAGGEGIVKAADHALRSEVEAAMTGGSFR